jgi:hypothetical protein
MRTLEGPPHRIQPAPRLQGLSAYAFCRNVSSRGPQRRKHLPCVVLQRWHHRKRRESIMFRNF